MGDGGGEREGKRGEREGKRREWKGRELFVSFFVCDLQVILKSSGVFFLRLGRHFGENPKDNGRFPNEALCLQ